jgi:murein DD-endopeptidase MepM/ murein hydrolase activator NlpD
VFAAWFVAGALTGWWLHGGPPRSLPAGGVRATDALLQAASPHAIVSAAAPPTEVIGEPTASAAIPPPAEAIDELVSRHLRLPVDDTKFEKLKGMFAETRGSDSRLHEAIDILAPRDTPVHAVEDGTIAKLFYSRAGGITVYEFDPDQRFCYYYAHLDRYATGLETGQRVTQGEIIGYVGTSGNAPANTPHLHFAIFALDANHHWWQGRAIDPYLVFERSKQ